MADIPRGSVVIVEARSESGSVTAVSGFCWFPGLSFDTAAGAESRVWGGGGALLVLLLLLLARAPAVRSGWGKSSRSGAARISGEPLKCKPHTDQAEKMALERATERVRERESRSTPRG